jgi:hypothetical protein
MSDTLNPLPKEVVTRNYFAPLRTTVMDTDTSGTEAMPHEGTVPGRTGTLPPTVVTSATKVIQLQKQLNGTVKHNFEFRSTRNGTRIFTKTMADFSTVRYYLETNNLAYFTFYLKSLKPINAVIRHLPPNTPAEDMSEGLVNLVLTLLASSR